MPTSWNSTYLWLGIALAAAALWLWRQGQGEDSWFKTREADRERKRKSEDLLGQAKLQRKGPLLLTGIRIDAPPHEILGIPSDAGRTQILKAHRDLMKRYHPDKLAPPNTPQWNEAQAIAAAINRAKEEMLKRL